MANFLQKIGDLAFRKPWLIISFWIVLLSILGGLAYVNMKPTSSSISIPGTDAQVAIDRAGELFPDSGSGSGRIVFHTADGKVADYKSQIESLIKEVKAIDGISQVASPFDSEIFVAKTGDIAYAQVQLDEGQGSIDSKTTTAVAEAVSEARTDGLQIEIGGDLIDHTPGEIVGVGEIGGVLVALMVLVITLGSLVAAGMPIVNALVAIGVSMAGLFALSQVIDISSTTPVLAIMLGLAVGIDYSLFIVNKYRNYVLAGLSYKEAAVRSIATAGSAVVFAALTVVIALAALSVLGIPFITTMGVVGAASIAISAVVAITLTPALLGLSTHHVFTRSDRQIVKKAQAKKGSKSVKLNKRSVWYKWGDFISSRPKTILLVTIAAIAIIAIPSKDLRLGLPTDQFAAKDSTQRRAYDLMAKGFGEGFNGPLAVVVEGLPAVGEAEKEAVRGPAMEQLNQQMQKAKLEQQAAIQQQMAQAVTPEQQLALQQQIAAATAEGEAKHKAALAEIEKTVEQYAKYIQLNKLADNISKMDNVAQVLPAMVAKDGTYGLIQVVPESSPSSSQTAELIQTLRLQDAQKKLSGDSNTTLAVTGSTALQEDINAKLSAALPVYLAVVVGLSLVLLILAFRSIWIPVKATLGFLLSVLAMFGALVAVFQWGWFGIAEAPGPIVSFMPIIAIGILFGLAMDYEFFLVSGMHEAYEKTKDHKKAVVEGFGAGAKVVTAAGVIMVSVFAGFVGNHDSTIQAIGFCLAVGILVDAFIVRMTIVPAAMSLMGKSAWWLPKWLEKRLPHISIEGK
mgnify:CR=1 FL=1